MNPGPLPCLQMEPPSTLTPGRSDGPNAREGRPGPPNAAQLRRDLWFNHCQALVAAERLKIDALQLKVETQKAQLQQLRHETQQLRQELQQTAETRDKALQKVQQMEEENYQTKVSETKAVAASKAAGVDVKRWEEKANSFSRQLVQGMKDWKANGEEKQSKIDTQARNLAVKDHEIRQLCKSNDDLKMKMDELKRQMDELKKQNQVLRREWQQKNDTVEAKWKQKYDALEAKYEAAVFGEAGIALVAKQNFCLTKNFRF